jgi:hypothetical protein
MFSDTCPKTWLWIQLKYQLKCNDLAQSIILGLEYYIAEVFPYRNFTLVN